MKCLKDVPPRSVLLKDNLIMRGIPYEYLNATLDDYKQNKDIKKFFKNYLINLHDIYEDNLGLLLYGNNGTGKTLLGCLVVKEAYRLRYNSAIVTLDRLINLTYKGENRTEKEEEFYNICMNADFLVIDEVGKENFPKSQSNIVFLESLMREALVKHQVLILITNLPLEDVRGKQGLYSLYGKSITSLISNSYVKIGFTDEDYRKNILVQKKSLDLLFKE